VTKDADLPGADAGKLPKQRIPEPPRQSLKALLAAVPLDGISLDRDSDVGRDVDP
jgi:hypothetical protein